jgi:succinate dehydrogenase/fumarate reductase flavoprotein subunit
MDSQYDFVVLGSGAAGLTAAIAAHDGGIRVAIVEKSEMVGGTSAWSGGQIWIPNHPHMAAIGRSDSREAALTYLDSLSHGMIDRAIAEAFVDAGPEMVATLERTTPVRFYPLADFPDYHPEHPGGSRDGGRTLECPPYPFGELGDWAEKVTVSPYWPNMHIAVGETTLGQPIPKDLPPGEMERRQAHDERGLGQSLIGRLLRACLDRGLEPMLGTRATGLIIEEGRVAGVRVTDAEGDRELRAPNVLIATGGFDNDPALVRAFLRGPVDHFVSPPGNTGDGLRMAMRAGAMLGNMREAWWMPIVEVPQEVNSAGKLMLTAERTLPGSIMVNREGRRFVNEAANYNAFGGAFHEHDVGAFRWRNLPCWVIFNQDFYQRYGFANHYGGEREARAEPPQWVVRAPTLAGLADRLGIPEGALEATVDRWNGQVDAGRDPDFHRGESAHDLWWGDPSMKGDIRATLGRIGAGPYYAVEVKSGALGTKGGPQTDARARVLDLDQRPIAGLYAAGNAMASPMGMTYGGAGGTLAPAMVFGFLAGRDAAARVAESRGVAEPA